MGFRVFREALRFFLICAVIYGVMSLNISTLWLELTAIGLSVYIINLILDTIRYLQIDSKKDN